MKKIITLFTIIMSFSAHSQYLKHQKVLFDVTAGYSVTASFRSGNENKNFDDTDLSGVLFDAAVYYRLGFNSPHMIGVRGSYVDAKNTFDVYMFDDFYAESIDKKYNSFFVGPSYKFEYITFNGKFGSSVSLTPGYAQINSEITDLNSRANIKASGYGFSLSATGSRRIIESFDWIIKIGLNYSQYSNFDVEFSGPKKIVIAENLKFSPFRMEFSTGFSYKF